RRTQHSQAVDRRRAVIPAKTKIAEKRILWSNTPAVIRDHARVLDPRDALLRPVKAAAFLKGNATITRPQRRTKQARPRGKGRRPHTAMFARILRPALPAPRRSVSRRAARKHPPHRARHD